MSFTNEDRMKLEYSETCNLNRHYSTVRATLTTFLLTAGLGAFAAYFSTTTKDLYLIYVGKLLIGFAVAVCVYFSFQTEFTNLYLIELWQFSLTPMTGDYTPGGIGSSTITFWQTALRTVRDPMNLLLIALLALTYSSLPVFGPLPRIGLNMAVAIVLVFVAALSSVALFIIVREKGQFMFATITSTILIIVVGLVTLWILST